jgi:hypothetical protein
MIDLLALWATPIVQAILAVSMLLVAVLCIRLDRRLSALRAGSDGVAATAAELAGAVARAEAAVQALKAATGQANAELERQIEEARAAGEALKFLTTAARAAEPGARSGVQPASGYRQPAPGSGPHPATMEPRAEIRTELDERAGSGLRLSDAERAARQAARWRGLR